MLKSAAPIIAPSIAKLINYSFSKSVFLQRWKTATVFPLFKGGDLENVNNYRPISVLPVLSKVIERHVHDTLYSYNQQVLNHFIQSILKKMMYFAEFHASQWLSCRFLNTPVLTFECNHLTEGELNMTFLPSFKSKH